MRKFSKRILKLALALAVVGLGLSIGGVAMGATITGINLTKYGLNGNIRKIANSALQESHDSWDETGMRSHSLSRSRQRMTKKSLRLTRYRIWIFP